MQNANAAEKYSGVEWRDKTMGSCMRVIDTNHLKVVERLPGWRGRYFDSANMSFAHYEFDEGSSIHRHSHEQEEVWQVIEGELDITVEGTSVRAGAGHVAIVPPNVLHSVKAIKSGRAYIVDFPLRPMP